MKKNNDILFKKQKLQKLAVATFTGYLLIEYSTILYLKANNTYTTFYLTDNTKIVASKNLGYFEEKLTEKLFFRTHHSFIVNLTQIKEFINTGDRGEVVLTNDKSILVSRSRKKVLLNFSNNYKVQTKTNTIHKI